MTDRGTDAVIHAAELENRSEYCVAASSFLTPTEQISLCTAVTDKNRLFFWGGYLGAERRAAVFLPEWAARECPFPFVYGREFSADREKYLSSLGYGDDCVFPEIRDCTVPVRITPSSFGEITHRSVLGSVLGLGLCRDAVGDVCIDGKEAVLFTSAALSKFICETLNKVGRESVKVNIDDSPVPFVYIRKTETVTVTVASMRLDCVVSALTDVSRSSAAELIEKGKVLLSYTETDSVSETVCPGDTVTVHGYGKFRITDDCGTTKKGRIRLTAEKYI